MTLKPWFQKAGQQALVRDIGNMTRQEAFNKGYLTVSDLDDEELRAGKCRDKSGKIPKTPNKTEPIPRDIYDELVVEHEARFNQRLREQLDDMINIMVDVAKDPTNEPRDRMEAAKYIFERVAGKTPERVAVTVQKAPWEEMLSGIAKITREQSHQIREGVIDAEVVDVHEANLAGQPGAAENGESHQTERPVTKDTVPEHYMRHYVTGDPRITFAPPAPNWDVPANSSSTATVDPVQHNQEKCDITNTLQAQRDLVEERKAARKRIQDAKKRRKIAKATAADAFGNKDIVAEFVESGGADPGVIKFDLES